MYKIIGGDQKQYGPISADQIRQWISEGRANGQTLICAEGSEDWKPLSAFPEFGFTTAPAAIAALGAESAGPASPEEILARDYSLDIAGCIARGWRLFTSQFVTVFITFILFLALMIGAGFAIQVIMLVAGVNKLSFATKMYLSPINTCFVSLAVGPALGGLYYVYISALRGRITSVADLFQGFKTFQDLFLGKLVPSLIMTAVMLPANIIMAHKLGPTMDRLKELQQNPQAMNPQEIFPQIMSGVGSALPVFLICMVPVMYLYVNWVFTLALIIDKKWGFWTAMTVSWKMVHRHWLHVFGLVVVMGLLNIAGVCCCIGVFVTVPVGLAALMYAYEDIFGRKTA